MDKIPENSVIREFEYKIAEYCGAKNCLSICNATVGILGVFYALGLSNAEVISTPLTWSGSISGLNMLNCKIRFCDIEHHTLTLNPDIIEPLITPNTKAVFSADFLGYPARLDKISKICKKHNLLLIHDAASSFGSRYKGYYSGYFADVSIFSFGSKKIFTTGEGGSILTENDIIFDKIANFLMHPERHAVERLQINPFALNSKINYIGAKYGIDFFEEQILELEKKREKSINFLKSIHFNLPNDFYPNFTKILLHSKHIPTDFKDEIVSSLCFKKLIFQETQYHDKTNHSKSLCPIAKSAVEEYKILTI